jgi:hypothetical protein
MSLAIRERALSPRALARVAAFACLSTLVGCGGSGSTSTSTPAQKEVTSAEKPSTPATESAKPAGAQNVAKLCATPCSDGEGDYVDQLALVHDVETSNPAAAVLAMRVRVENTASGKVEADPTSFELIDAHKRTLHPVASARQKGTRRPVPQCRTLSAVTLRSGDTHAFFVCYELPESNDLPKLLKLGEEEEIPLQ